ncbi:Tim10/DDP family zinc finger-domain-containing protein [Hypoxylon fragiforme]|uniref:Tim10/DDP family zinc finger-domain-containing protein n=1 Tax=Hypoxylon fragiforme TaxID=63214 RepID=UPI0020C6600E|nr:Tim10/DDP family zinc finger-domain-containing protein [Hypoxylon fragiforme]KAI2612902.1 Tim10/DDP family zinc finger-domain-containing protein [Hypoxylon fragiforme]
MESEAIKAEVVKGVRAQYGVENARQLVEKINEHCFEKCVPKPGGSLSNSEQTCFTQCMEKYMSAWNQVSTTYINRLQRGQ